MGKFRRVPVSCVPLPDLPEEKLIFECWREDTDLKMGEKLPQFLFETIPDQSDLDEQLNFTECLKLSLNQLRQYFCITL